jgi:hypothetical protein
VGMGAPRLLSELTLTEFWQVLAGQALRIAA